MPKTKITKKILEEFISEVEGGKTQLEAAKGFGIGIESFRKASVRLDVKWPAPRIGPKEEILRRREEIITSSKSQGDWAKEFNTTQSYLSKLFADSGIRDERLKARMGKHFPDKIEDARRH